MKNKIKELIEKIKKDKEYSKKMEEDNRVQNVLFPVRDGLMIVRKK